MIALLDNGQDLDQCAAEIGVPVGQLLTPLTSYSLRAEKFAIDNGGFNEVDVNGVVRLMRREEQNRERCFFVTAPDVACSALRTIELFHHFKDLFEGWPIAFVCQDGQENLPMPWDKIDAIFIGGSTTVTEAAKRYLAAIDSDPENDIWDTWDGKPAEGALKTASDASWADHGQTIEARLSELRAVIATTEGQP